jgi:ABC-2 type transport system ATP-binding protein
VHELLERFGLWDRREDPAGTWSRGMKQKLAIARALVHQPQLVFLDEPTAGLDPIAAAALRNELAALAEQTGTSIFLTTHNLAEAERLCARIGVVANGRLVAHGHPDELRAARGGEQVEFVGRHLEASAQMVSGMPHVRSAAFRNGRLVVHLERGASVAPMVAALVHSGAEIEEVRRDAASLEDVFMELIEDPNRE